MASIIGGVLAEDTFEDMVELAMFPPAAEYDTFDEAFISANQRLKGAANFDFYGSKSVTPLVRWRCISAYQSGWLATQSPIWTGTIEIEFMASGAQDHDTLTVSSHKRLVRYWAQASEAINKQNAGTGYSDGAFFRSNAGVTAPGVQVLGVGDISVRINPAQKRTDIGADVWTMYGTVVVQFAAGPGA